MLKASLLGFEVFYGRSIAAKGNLHKNSRAEFYHCVRGCMAVNMIRKLLHF